MGEQESGKRYWYVAIQRTVEVTERAEDVEVQASSEEEAMRLALEQANSPRFHDWVECDRRVLYEDVERTTTFAD